MERDVFRALSDPTRRQILDLLRDGPRTTGSLADGFDQSRFGVMKHLRVLEQARLITVRRQGRQRFNHLNAVPLREMYERWLGPYQEFWSSSLLRLRDLAEAVDPKPNREKPMADFNSFEIVQKVELKAAPDKVWSALTTDIGKWWAFHLGDEGSEVSLDARLGGSFEERWGDGEGCFWGKVVDIRRGTKLRLKGPLGMTGAGVNDYVYELEANGDGTTLTLTHHAIGYTDPETEKNFTQGWQQLLVTCLPAWLQDGKTYDQLG